MKVEGVTALDAHSHNRSSRVSRKVVLPVVVIFVKWKVGGAPPLRHNIVSDVRDLQNRHVCLLATRPQRPPHKDSRSIALLMGDRVGAVQSCVGAGM